MGIDETDESTVTISQALRLKTRFTFEYDVGDDERAPLDVERTFVADLGSR